MRNYPELLMLTLAIASAGAVVVFVNDQTVRKL